MFLLRTMKFHPFADTGTTLHGRMGKGPILDSIVHNLLPYQGRGGTAGPPPSRMNKSGARLFREEQIVLVKGNTGKHTVLFVPSFVPCGAIRGAIVHVSHFIVMIDENRRTVSFVGFDYHFGNDVGAITGNVQGARLTIGKQRQHVVQTPHGLAHIGTIFLGLFVTQVEPNGNVIGCMLLILLLFLWWRKVGLYGLRNGGAQLCGFLGHHSLENECI